MMVKKCMVPRMFVMKAYFFYLPLKGGNTGLCTNWTVYKITLAHWPSFRSTSVGASMFFT